jgi:hypothetical protein
MKYFLCSEILPIGKRLAAQKGQSDDLAGALQAQADRRELENASDSDEDV